MKPHSIPFWFAVAAWAPAALAHDLWLEPSSYHVAVGEPIRVTIRVGERFSGEAVPRTEARIERFIMLGPEGQRPVIGREGEDPAGLTRATAEGMHLIGYVTYPTRLELDAERFEKYLKEEGLERVIEDRATRGESAAPGREQYSRSVKSLVRVGQNASGGFDRAMGLPLELIPLQNPLDLNPGDRLTCRLLFHGKPLAGARVDAFNASRAGQAQPSMQLRTDDQGQVTFTLDRAGAWLIRTLHMERIEGSEVQWASTWSSLTFQLPQSADKD